MTTRNPSSFLNRFFHNEIFLISAVLISLILIFSGNVIFSGQYYTANEYLYKFPPWNGYPTTNFGNYNALLEDEATHSDPFMQYLHDEFQQGQYDTMWNSYSFTGVSLTDLSFNSPISYLFFVTPYWLSYNIIVVAKLFISGIGMYFLLREFKCGKIGSLASSISFVFSGALVLNIGVNSTSATAMMFPFVLLFVQRMLYNVSWKNVICLSLSLGMLLLGAIESATLFLYLVAAYFLFQYIRLQKNSIRKKLVLPLSIISSFVMGLSLIMIYLVGFVNQLFGSTLFQERSTQTPPQSVSTPHMITNILPNFFGNPTYGWWSSGNYHQVNFNHVGVISIFFALIGSVFVFAKKAEVRFFSIALLLFFGFNYGISGITNAFRLLPGLNLINTIHAEIIVAFLFSILAGYGANFLYAKSFKSKKTIIIVSTSIIISMVAIAGISTLTSLNHLPSFFYVYKNPSAQSLQYTPPSMFYQSMYSELTIVLVISFLILIITVLYFLNKVPPKIFAVSALAILTISGLQFGMNYNSTSYSYEPPTTPDIKYIQNDKSLYRVLPTSFILPPDTQLSYKIQSIKGSVLASDEVHQVFQSLGDVRGNRASIIDDYSSPLLNLLNVKYVLIPSTSKINNQDNRYEMVFKDSSVQILKNNQVLPREFMVYDFIKTTDGDIPKDWSKSKFLVGWIKGNGVGGDFTIKILGPTSNDYVEYLINDDSKDWKKFVVDISNPNKTSGNPDLSKSTGLVITGPSDKIFSITELEFLNDSLQSENSGSIWSLHSYPGNGLSCTITQRNDQSITVKITSGGTHVECFFVHDFAVPLDISKYKFFNYWMNRNGVYQLYIFGPTMNDYVRYDTYQYSIEHLSKVNVNLNAPIEVHGNPDFTKVIRIRIDPGEGTSTGVYTISNPTLLTSSPIEILYKIHHDDYDNLKKGEKVSDTPNMCNILLPEQTIGPLDPRFISKVPTHQPKDLFYFESKEENTGKACQLTLIPKYSQTLLLLSDPNFDYTKKIVINDEIDNDIQNQLFGEANNKIETVKYDGNELTLKVSTEKPGFLFVSDSYDKGWKAYVDGNASKIYKTDWAFRSVFVPEGSHEIIFKYSPESYSVGQLISGGTISFMVIGSIIIFAKERSKKHQN